METTHTNTTEIDIDYGSWLPSQKCCKFILCMYYVCMPLLLLFAMYYATYTYICIRILYTYLHIIYVMCIPYLCYVCTYMKRESIDITKQKMSCINWCIMHQEPLRGEPDIKLPDIPALSPTLVRWLSQCAVRWRRNVKEKRQSPQEMLLYSFQLPQQSTPTPHTFHGSQLCNLLMRKIFWI